MPRYKRIWDLTFVTLVTLFLFPIWLPAWIFTIVAVFVTMGRPIFYTQTRAGLDGREFKIIKFRTMINDAERHTGAILAEENDPRITKLGKILRRGSLDEAPQVFNIIKGEMSLVGPRPERPELIRSFDEEIPGFTDRLQVQPGIVHLAYVRKPGQSYHLSKRHYLRYDMFYIKHMGPGMDAWMTWTAFRNAVRKLVKI